MSAGKRDEEAQRAPCEEGVRWPASRRRALGAAALGATALSAACVLVLASGSSSVPSAAKEHELGPGGLCEIDRLQDAWRISDDLKSGHYGQCAQICLNPHLKTVAGHHGVQYGSTCEKQGCTQPAGTDKRAGQPIFFFSCANGTLLPPLPPPDTHHSRSHTDAHAHGSDANATDATDADDDDDADAHPHGPRARRGTRREEHASRHEARRHERHDFPAPNADEKAAKLLTAEALEELTDGFYERRAAAHRDAAREDAHRARHHRREARRASRYSSARGAGAEARQPLSAAAERWAV